VTHYEEDINLPNPSTYIAGGIVVGVSKGVLVEQVDHITLKAETGLTLGGTGWQAAVARGSESGQFFRLKAYQTGGTSGDFTELAAGATLGGRTIHVSYEGT
jgi:hypothetical protein